MNVSLERFRESSFRSGAEPGAGAAEHNRAFPREMIFAVLDSSFFTERDGIVLKNRACEDRRVVLQGISGIISPSFRCPAVGSDGARPAPSPAVKEGEEAPPPPWAAIPVQTRVSETSLPLN